MNSMAAEPGPRTKHRIAVFAGVFAFGLVIGTLLLWAQLGTAVFFEAIRAGIAYCF